MKKTIFGELQMNAPMYAMVTLVFVIGVGCETWRSVTVGRVEPVYVQDEHGVKLDCFHELITLEYRGKRYDPLYSNYYVFIPQLDGIIFTTRKGSQSPRLHFVPAGSGEEVAAYTVDGFGIFLGRSKEAQDTEYVEGVTNGVVSLVSRTVNYHGSIWQTNQSHYILDLKRGTFELKAEANATPTK